MKQTNKQKKITIETFENSQGKKAGDLNGIIIICYHDWRINQREERKRYRKRSTRERNMPKVWSKWTMCPHTAIRAMVFYSVYSLCCITQEKGNKSGWCLTFKKYWIPVNHPATDIIIWFLFKSLSTHPAAGNNRVMACVFMRQPFSLAP